ncbi:hypothetical protein C1894_15920 [Pseudomonas sp. FW305-3-2-15-E-TSA2]|nr:hypothetical protein C1895_15330 [Pseudomonas sp. FW305-3-2-15-E-TSA4]POA41253.1 hypothetical protein C1894_15920 [Pseudomonas sp. FW305-3-2-15-E-TSA2]
MLLQLPQSPEPGPDRGGLLQYPLNNQYFLWELACSRMRFNIQHDCWLTHRFREQARSHI